MVPTSFEGENAVLGAPEGVGCDQVAPLSVLRTQYTDGTPVVISCWKVTAEELAEIQRTGRVWLHVLGYTMPPVLVMGTRSF